MAKRKDGGLAAGTTTFVIVPSLSADRIFTWQAVTGCLQCGRRFILRRGEAAAVLRAGNEILGSVCPSCLSEESRQVLQSMRGEVAS